ncbi:MAG: DUF364 domain-containing protein [Spirochaetaceae bacterium]|jgi:uncharacterized protein (DUF4213/DUF364 family)|nr:DUF364 domain-containing protein [Spirochaetaceae bacterium]
MWKLYDALLDPIPGDIRVAETFMGGHWIAVRAEDGGLGLAMRINSATVPAFPAGEYAGLSLKALGQAAKSWNFISAGYGVAAINAYYNRPERAAALGIDLSCPSLANEAFRKYRDQIAGKKAAVIGHFPYLEALLGPVCELSIIERKPRPGDYPDPACEYLLPEQDYVFITGSALVNKTLPRLLQLCRGYAVLVGPSVPLAPALFDFGADDLSGFVALDPDRCLQAIAQDAAGRHFDAGTMVHFKAPGLS